MQGILFYICFNFPVVRTLKTWISLVQSSWFVFVTLRIEITSNISLCQFFFMYISNIQIYKSLSLFTLFFKLRRLKINRVGVLRNHIIMLLCFRKNITYFWYLAFKKNILFTDYSAKVLFYSIKADNFRQIWKTFQVMIFAIYTCTRSSWAIMEQTLRGIQILYNATKESAVNSTCTKAYKYRKINLSEL